MLCLQSTLLVIAFLVLSSVVVVKVNGFSVEGKTVLVTGSAGGIGKGIARALAEKGAKVILHYYTRKDEAYEFSRELGPDKCLGVVQADFKDISSLSGFFQRVRDLCQQESSSSLTGKVDILVNNAGAITKLALQDDDDQMGVWQDTLAVNLHAPALLGKLFVSQFSQSCFCDAASNQTTTTTTLGVLLNVGSIHGDRSNEFKGAYAASKAGLESLTRTQAIEYGPMGIRANGIAPGIVPVERTNPIFDAQPEMLQV